LVAERDTPLVVAAVEWLASAYLRISKHPSLVQDYLPGNPDETPDHELHRLAWQLVEPVFRAEEEVDSRRVREMLGTPLASCDLKEVVIAAHDGRIETAFVALGVQRWGRYDAESRQIEEYTSRRNGDQDLLDLAAAQTLIHGGTVYAVDPEDIPGEGSPVAAIFRYDMKGIDPND
jgi:hypothetical protein